MRSRLAFVLASAVIMLHAGSAGAAETGRIEGVVTNESTGRPQPGVEITLTKGTSDGERVIDRSTTTDERGRYVFDELETGEEVFYAIDGTYEGGLFSGGAITLPEDTEQEPVIETTLRVWETTTDASAIVLSRDSLFLNQRENLVSVVEAVTVANLSREAYIGRGGAGMVAGPGDGTAVDADASIGFPLPAAANPGSVRIVESDLNIPELVPTDFGFGATVAIPPGETMITFSYTTRGTGGSFDLSRTALYPTLRLSIYAADPLEVSSNRLVEEGEVEVGEQTYDHHAIDRRLEAGDALQVVALADAGVPAGLLAGMAGALALVLVLGVFPLLGRRKRAAEEEAVLEQVDEREALLTEIAELDVKRERGEVDEEQWATRRAALKARLLQEHEEPR